MVTSISRDSHLDIFFVLLFISIPRKWSFRELLRPVKIDEPRDPQQWLSKSLNNTQWLSNCSRDERYFQLLCGVCSSRHYEHLYNPKQLQTDWLFCSFIELLLFVSFRIRISATSLFHEDFDQRDHVTGYNAVKWPHNYEYSLDNTKITRK